jgi:enoyl reductase-like protein
MREESRRKINFISYKQPKTNSRSSTALHKALHPPIHEIANGRNERIKQFYWKLWYGNDEVLPNIDIHEHFVGPDATIDSSDVEQFCAVVGNQEESFKIARNDNWSPSPILLYHYITRGRLCRLTPCWIGR